MKQILQSFKTGEMWLAEMPAPLCRAKGVVVRTAASFVSAGTERMLAEFAKKGLVGKMIYGGALLVCMALKMNIELRI